MTFYVDSIETLKDSVNKNAESILTGKRCTLSRKQLQDAMNGNLHLKNFPSLGKGLFLDKFSWQSNGEDRNWWWQLQALPFLNWYIGAYEFLNIEEKLSSKKFICDAIRCWLHNSNDQSPLLWHDHASAFRLRNITNWLSFCFFKEDFSFIIDENIGADIVNSINRHIDFLLDNKNYSKHTNHGFDQMFCLFNLCLLWPKLNNQEHVVSTSYNRLIDELEFAFTHEGVHKENSPGYQNYMLGKLKDLTSLKKLKDNTLSQYAEEKLQKANDYLNAIILPNGKLPMIGDTDGNTFIKDATLSPGLNIYDYSSSGYVIVSGIDNNDNNYHLVIKNSHSSVYHRHDDDLSIHLYYNEEIVLGDGGLGFYQEKDERRIFLRSSASHSTIVIPDSTPVRDNFKLKNPPKMWVDGNIITACSFSCGVEAKRIIDVSNILNGELRVTDEVFDAIAFETNFFIPATPDVEIIDSEFNIRFNNFSANISINDGESSPFIFSGSDHNVVCSFSYAEFKDALRFGWSYKSPGKRQWILSIHSDLRVNDAPVKKVNAPLKSIRRNIRLKEWPPLSKLTKIPTDEYISNVDKLPQASYQIETDRNGFILTSRALKDNNPLWLFMGDSFVESIFVHHGKRFTDLLAIRSEHVNILNGGYSGTTSLQIINSILNKAIPLAPEKIFIFIPSNDSRCMKISGGYWNNTKLLSPIVGDIEGDNHDFDFGDNLSQLDLMLNIILDITNRMKCKLYLCTTPHRHSNYASDKYLKTRYPKEKYFNRISSDRLRIGQHVREWCHRENVMLIDLERDISNFIECSYDDVHLNEHGSEVVANIIETFLDNNG
ncbi:heparinase II/III family protein [Aeromonas sanarellii]